MQKITIFVASASEAHENDRLIRSILDGLEVNVLSWRELARPGEMFLDGLIDGCKRSDAAVLIATADDLVNSRGTENLSPRDNILLEIGMCLTGLGRDRVAIAHFSDGNGKHPKLPSDLEGLFVLRSDESKINKLEFDVHNWVQGLTPKISDQAEQLNTAIQKIDRYSKKLSGESAHIINNLVVKRFLNDVSALSSNEIIVNQAEYFAALYSEMEKSVDGSDIVAIATMSGDMWDRDPEQIRYAEKNLAAAKRGAQIRRLFVCSDRDWADISHRAKAQISAGIKVRRISTAVMKEIRHLEDIVVFRHEGSSPVGFVAESDIQNPTRVRRGKIVLNVANDMPALAAFEQVWIIAEEIGEFTLNRSIDNNNTPPGLLMEISILPQNVITCEEAAQAKDIALKNELKTLILNTSDGLIALHLRGDRKASLRAVKNALGVSEAYMLDSKRLNRMDLSPGTVSAVLEPVWSMPHLISRSVLAEAAMYTNAGKLNEYFGFPPETLLQAKSTLIGDFEE